MGSTNNYRKKRGYNKGLKKIKEIQEILVERKRKEFMPESSESVHPHNERLNKVYKFLSEKKQKSQTKFTAVEKEFEEKNLDETKAKDLRNTDYHNYLLEAANNSDEYSDILTYLPKFYKLLCNIDSNPKTDWYSKMLVNVALSYLVLETDLIPEKKSSKGYVDDLYLCAYVLKEIRDRVSKKIIIENLDKDCEDENILGMIYSILTKSSEILGDKSDEILEFVGLKRFNLFDFTYKNDEDKAFTRLKKKKNLLYAMLAVKTNQVLNERNKIYLRYDYLVEYIKGHPDFVEVRRFMEFNK